MHNNTRAVPPRLPVEGELFLPKVTAEFFAERSRSIGRSVKRPLRQGLRSSGGVDALADELADDVFGVVVDSDKREAERDRGRL